MVSSEIPLIELDGNDETPNGAFYITAGSILTAANASIFALIANESKHLGPESYIIRGFPSLLGISASIISFVYGLNVVNSLSDRAH